MKRKLAPVTVRGVMTAALITVATSATAYDPPNRIPSVKALDMWGVEHDLHAAEWVLFDYVHSAGCGYCVLNAHEYQENFGDGLAPAGVVTYGVDVFEDQRDLVDYVKHHRIRYPILTEPGRLWRRCPGLPGQRLFRDGKVVYGASQTRTLAAYDGIRAALRAAGAGDEVRAFRPAGPLKKALNAVYEDPDALVVVGDGAAADPELLFPGLRRVLFDIKRARDVTEEDLSRRSLLVVGDVDDNAFLSRLGTQIPFQIDVRAIAFADTVVMGEDLHLWACVPSPWNPERYLVLSVGGAGIGGAMDASQDFVISRRGESSELDYAIVARGIFRKHSGHWQLPASAVVWGERLDDASPEQTLACGVKGCPLPARTASTRDVTPVEPGRGELTLETIVLGAGRFPALAVGGDGHCWIAWGRRGAGITVASAQDRARETRHLAVTESGEIDAYKPTICEDGEGGCWVAWTERYKETYQVFAARVGREAGVSTVWRVSNRSNLDHSGPSLVRGREGDVRLTWNAWQANSRRPRQRVWRADGWSSVTAGPRAAESLFAWYHSTAANRDGTIQSVWMQHYPALPTGIYAASASTGEWGEPIEISKTGRAPSIASSPIDDRTFIVWQQRAGSPSALSLSASELRLVESAGDEWSAPVTVPGSGSGRNETPVVTVDGAGRTWVAWSRKDSSAKIGDARWQIHCAVRDASGWHGPFRLSAPTIDARSPAIASFETRVWVAWHQGTGDEMEIAIAEVATARDAARVETSSPTRS